MSRARDVANRDIVDGSIVNADINASAAIASSKLSGVVSNSLISASKGALITSTGSAVDDLTVGADGTVLTADSGETLGIKWAAAASGADIDPLFLAGV